MNLLLFVHVALSLAGIGSGLAILYGLIAAKRMDGWNAFFLITTAATSVTGFLFPIASFTPAHGVGIVSLIALSIAIAARRRPGWPRTYAVTAVLALYLNVFVLVVQLFQKVSALRALAPTQSEPPFATAQGVVLLLFVWLGRQAVITAAKTDRLPG